MALTDHKKTSFIEMLLQGKKHYNEVCRYFKSLKKSTFTDTSKIILLFDRYKTLTGNNVDEWTLRREFILVILCLYVPGTIVGECIPRRIKEQLAKLFGIKSIRGIEHYTKDLMFQHFKYPSFKRNVDLAIEKFSEFEVEDIEAQSSEE